MMLGHLSSHFFAQYCCSCGVFFLFVCLFLLFNTVKFLVIKSVENFHFLSNC